ncbi:MAG: efflux RND transporter periplasmic adaptor subunit, partial [Planctomyces sp.]
MTPLAIEVQTESKPVPRYSAFSREDHSLTVFAVPLIDHSGVAEGALVLLMRGRVENAELLLSQLDMLAGSVSLRLADLISVVPDASGPLNNESQMTDHRPDRQAVIEAAVIEDSGAKSPLIQSVSASADAETLRPAELPVPAETTSSSSLREFAYSLVNSLCNQLRAEQVGFGLREGGRIRVLAVSGLAEVKSANPGISMMQQAMEECLDEAHPIVSPTPDSETGARKFVIHRRWSSETSGACVASIPITDAQGVMAVVSLRLPPGRAMRPELVSSISTALQKHSHSIRLLEKVSRSLTSHLRTAVADKLRQLTGKNSVLQKTVVAFAAGLCLWCLFGTLTYRPICNARITAENLLQMTSGSESKLKVVHVVSGEKVQAGQLLAEFETAELELQLQALQREIASTEVDVRRAIDARDTGAAALGRARIGVLITQAASVEKRIERARLRAPRDGVIVRADLEKRVGQVFTPGETVLEFASEGGWILAIEVPDDIATLVQSDQAGMFAASSFASDSMPFRISSIDGTAQVMEGRNVFVARAQLDEQREWIRSGMEGTA